MQIGFEYIEGSGPYNVVGFLNDKPFELHYFDGEAELVIITEDYVITTTGEYNRGLGVLNQAETGQLIFNMVSELDKGV